MLLLSVGRSHVSAPLHLASKNLKKFHVEGPRQQLFDIMMSTKMSHQADRF